MLELVPITLKEANAFVERYHRHHKPVREESEAVENDEYITGYNSTGIAGDIFKTGQTGREGKRE